jgi:hypothetical protein
MLVDGKITSGVQHFKRKPKEPRGKTMSDLFDWFINLPIPRPAVITFENLSEQEDDNEPTWDLIVYEQPHQRGGAATFFGMGLAAQVEFHAYLLNSPVMTEHTMTIKKFASGAAKVTDGKSQTLARAQQFDPSITDDNEADALCLLFYVMTQKGIAIPPRGQGE